ncbi:MlaE family ABC transporter permease [Nitrospina gracilis]|uniref:MlaE family ABC transporter permease n=1 Tax=Nitrospina gracilis TaxID=35801 RepID=UPI001F353E99|nr:MlaE family lipid ABC transporter permease subunit [Nitrospina gracilis]MCF8721442.1 phospholipid/cholesterol/gamma-HCH transport system permease protein [Nitrospina gracilis Nb-211]
MNFLQTTGRLTLDFIQKLGVRLIFLLQVIGWTFRPPFKLRETIKQANFIGVKSLFVILLTAVFTGMVLGMQGYYSLRKFGSEGLLGSAVALTIIRELGPVLAALMVTGRAGSAIAAEIGIMRISEQLDALDTMALSPLKYVVMPKVVAALVAIPLLTAIFDVVGIFGGYMVGVHMFGVSAGSFVSGMELSVEWKDVYSGIVKSICFALLMAWICCFEGYFVERYSGHGAEGVSQATTHAVVLSSVNILVWDYVITSFMI